MKVVMKIQLVSICETLRRKCYLLRFVIIVIAVVCISKFRGLNQLIEKFLSYLDNFINTQFGELDGILWKMQTNDSATVLFSQENVIV